MGLKETVKQLWTLKIEKEYRRLLSERKVSYADWAKMQEKTASSIREKSADNGYVLFVQKQGRLSEHALAWIEECFAANPKAQMIYGDEDFLGEEGERKNPWYKPCWSPDAYQSQFYPGSVIALRKEVCEQGAFFENAGEIHALISDCIHKIGGFEKSCESIVRCNKILFHVNDKKVWQNYLQTKVEGEVTEKIANDISVIIPSKDNPGILKNCLESLKDIQGLEIIVVDNGSSDKNREQIEEMTKLIGCDAMRNQKIQYLYQPMEFNFSRMCNMGAEAAGGKYLLFLNDDIEVCGTEWIYAMRAKAIRPYVGAVGLKLYYPDSVRIQHAGITNLPVGPVHKMQFMLDEGSIYFDKNKANVNCIAVTGACLLIDRDKYAEVGGFKESLRVAYNDVDLGFALYEAGYQNVVINEYFAYHHESLSRGSDESEEKRARLQREREHLYEMHPALNGEDPYYPDGLFKEGLDSRIVPEYINGRNFIQQACVMPLSEETGGIRVDNCVLLGIELSENGRIKGYGVVLGDNNACYDRYIVLEPCGVDDQGQVIPGTKGKGDVFTILTQPMYRQDLEENLPDQKNVAMSGFYIRLTDEECKKLNPGRTYRVGVMAMHKINKGKLLNWSGRYFKI